MDDTCSHIILCVDDEAGVLASYRQVLGQEEDPFAALLAEKDKADRIHDDSDLPDYTILTASSGEEGVKIVQEMQAAGKRIAAGFFDMRMPGGIDGLETIRQIRAIDTDVYCAVVTAYTDRQISQVRKLFAPGHQDELLYFKKPFTASELEQTAFNMVSAWNRKRKAEFHLRSMEQNRQGLRHILSAVSDLMVIPPRGLGQILSGILCQCLSLSGCNDGFLVFFDEQGEVRLGKCAGRFAALNPADLYRESGIKAEELQRTGVIATGRAVYLPLIAGRKIMGVICLDQADLTDRLSTDNLLEIFRDQMVSILMNSIFYEHLLEEKYERLSDPVTGVFTRHFVIRRLHEEIKRSARFAFTLSFLAIGIDNLPPDKNSLGPSALHDMLRHTADVLLQSVRAYDVVARCDSAEEIETKSSSPPADFLVILAQTDQTAAMAVTERIAGKIGLRPWIDHTGNELRLSVSIGLASATVTSGDTTKNNALDNLVDQAISALQQARHDQAQGKDDSPPLTPLPDRQQ